MAPSFDKGTGYALESGSNFEESNYFDEATDSRSKIRKLLKSESSVQNLALRLKYCNATETI